MSLGESLEAKQIETGAYIESKRFPLSVSLTHRNVATRAIANQLNLSISEAHTILLDSRSTGVKLHPALTRMKSWTRSAGRTFSAQSPTQPSIIAVMINLKDRYGFAGGRLGHGTQRSFSFTSISTH